jgi:hypothetical protein
MAVFVEALALVALGACTVRNTTDYGIELLETVYR